MTFNDFIAGKALTSDDLFGEWKQKGFTDMSDPASAALASKMLNWMRMRVKRALKRKELTVPANCACKFKRGKGGDGKAREIMAIYAGDVLLKTITTGYGDFIVSDAGNAHECAKAEKENVRKGKCGKSEKEDRTLAEIQDATPIELRHSWTNYALLDKINEELAEKSVKYWNDNDGKFPKRKMRKRA